MRGFVYAVRDTSTDTIIYVGSCIRKYLSQRIGDHRKPSNTCNTPFYSYVKDNGGWENFSFEQLEEYENPVRNDLLYRERYFIETLDPLCNRIRPVITKQECNERKRQTNKQWRQNNPEKVADQILRKKTKEWYQEIVSKRCRTQIECECGGKYTLQNKTNHFNSKIHTVWVNTNS